MLTTAEQATLDGIARQLINLNASLKDKALADIYTEILDTDEAAKYLKISTRYLQILRDKGEIRFSQHATVIRYKKSDLDKWINDHRVGR